MDLWLIFLTGLTVGGLTCLAVQGGLLASLISLREKEISANSQKHILYVTGTFLLFKFLAYTILGFILGAFGEIINISGNIQTFMQLIAGIYMIVVSLNLLNVHPIFRYAIIQPPRFLTRKIRNQSKSKDIFAPAVLGVMTIFIPCGTTLAMEALAISSANPVWGALIMASFILGTIPLFFGIGYVTSVLGETFRKHFLTIAAIALIYLGITSINGAFTALGYPLTLNNFAEFLFGSTTNSVNEKLINQNPEIKITSQGYAPNYIQVKKGSIVNLKLISQDAYSCASAFRIPSLGIGANLGPNETKIISFTPQNTGKILFTCAMGMFTGIIEVI